MTWLTETPAEKRCPHCGQVKPAEAFGLRSRDGVLLKSWCRACMDETRRKYVEEHGSGFGRLVDWRDMPHGRLVHDGEQRTMSYRRAHWREQVAALEQAEERQDGVGLTDAEVLRGEIMCGEGRCGTSACSAG